MTNILTSAEAATVLRCVVTDQAMLDLLPLVDGYLETATGRDWTKDTTIYPQAKSAARMLLVRWHEDPGGMAAGGALGFGLVAVMVQLKALAMLLGSAGVPFEPLRLININLYGEMAISTNVVLQFNNEMAADAISHVTLQTSAGGAVATTNTLDVTGKVLTVNPNSNLASNTAYLVVLDHPADVYGQTVDTTLDFWTED
ncbi:MAG: Ig-like domain-containing protein [Anaerolineaceae bacterium]|nr:Ig-like domain-containing protein [Anaerolineaceae bacterium]MDD5367516.1 Ig-like domain-containing protein [Anaerolineaceae bacterium]